MRMRVPSTRKAFRIPLLPQATIRTGAPASANIRSFGSVSCKGLQTQPPRWRPASSCGRSWHAEWGLSTSLIRSSSSVAPPSPRASSSRLNLVSPPDNGYISASNPATLERLKSANPDELQIWPDFLDEREQRVLLGAALKKLDATVGGREERKRRRECFKREKLQGELVGFAPDDVYEWQDRHFDGVISSYRESILSTWPVFLESELNDALAAILARIYTLLPELPSGEAKSAADAQESSTPRDAPSTTPPSHLLTHLLQLSSTGYILPHIDNVEASAGRILGVCLGAERELVLTHPERDGDEIRVRLPPGCAYMQSGTVRYDWKHAIPPPAADEGEKKRGQRLSVMIRDRVQ